MLRRVIKKVIHPFISENQYIKIQATSQARDIESGNWSEPELDIVKCGVKEGETCLDLGANFGQYAYHLSKAVGKSGKVYSFEPIPYTYKTLELVAEKLDLSNVETVNKGCGNENGQVTFQVPLQTSGAFSAGQAYLGSRNDDHSGKETQVRWQETQEVVCDIVRLDDFLPPLENLTLIKADVEGAELFAFRGAEKIIDKFLPAVICEINPWFFDGFGIKLEDLTDFFLDKGYRIYFYESETEDKFLREVAVKDIVEDNYVFLHTSNLERFSSLLK